MSKILDIKGITDITNFDIRADENISMKTGGIEHASINSVGTFSINNTNTSLSVTSGALVVSGGVGIGQNINIDGNANIGGLLTVGSSGSSSYSFPAGQGEDGNILFLSGGSLVFGPNISDAVTTLDNFGTDNRMLKTSGTGKEIVASTSITINDSDDISGIRNLETDGFVSILSNVPSNTSSTGALVVSGGVGIGGKLNVEDLDVNQSATFNEVSVTNNSTLGGALKVTGSTTLGGTLEIDGNTIMNSTLTVLNSDDSFGSTTGASIKTSGGMSIAKNLFVGGNLTIEGTSTTVNSTTTSIIDPMFKLADGNPGDSYDFGIYGEYVSGGNIMYSGFHRVGQDSGPVLPEGAGKWILFDGATTEPGSLNVTDPGLAADLVVGELNATTVRITHAGGSTTSGSITLDYPTGSNYTLFFPGTQGSASNVLINDGSGNLSWGKPTADPNFTVPVAITDTTDSVSVSTGALKVSGGVGIVKDVYIGGNLNVDDEVRITNTNGSTTINTGALIVSGGVGISENVHIGGTLNTSNAATIGGDFLVSSSNCTIDGTLVVGTNSTIGGNLNVSGDTTLIKLGVTGVTTLATLDATGAVTITDLTAATTSSTGALVVSGGAGIGGDLHIGGTLYSDSFNISGSLDIPDTTVAEGATSGSLTVQGGIGVAKNMDIGTTLEVSGTSELNGVVTITDTSVADGNTSGALIVQGGIHVDKNLEVTTDLTVSGDSMLTNLKANGRIAGKVRTTAVSTSLDDDYILNVSAASTITLPTITNSTYNGVTYMVVKTTSGTVTIDATTTNIFQTSGNVQTIDMIGSIGERIMLISNGIDWYTM